MLKRTGTRSNGLLLEFATTLERRPLAQSGGNPRPYSLRPRR